MTRSSPRARRPSPHRGTPWHTWFGAAGACARSRPSWAGAGQRSAGRFRACPLPPLPRRTTSTSTEPRDRSRSATPSARTGTPSGSVPWPWREEARWPPSPASPGARFPHPPRRRDVDRAHRVLAVPGDAARLGLVNEYAAMPSLHVGRALWSGRLLFRHARRRVWRGCGLAYPVFTALVVVARGNHYLADALVRALLIALFGVLDGVIRPAGGRAYAPTARSTSPTSVARLSAQLTTAEHPDPHPTPPPR
ncbi:phosphatase PAP2 family protein [Streptomyces fagopyri]|uniref:phosphatase PAP2 family protein n=1 Tax=Streptomyces fagopyri TaxID=2662397 RepID=UPI0038166AA4